MSARVVVTSTTVPQAKRAIEGMVQEVRAKAGGAAIKGALLYCSVGCDVAALQQALTQALPGVPFLGVTSCLGVGVKHEFLRDDSSVAAAWFVGEGFRFGAAVVEKTGEAEATGEAAAESALKSGEMPTQDARFVFMHATPGAEEALLRGIYRRVKPDVPVLGGSAADNDLSGKWSVFGQNGVFSNGVAVAVCDWPWRFATAYRSGYMPAGPRGKVTRANGRVLYELDGRPAAVVYNEWLEGGLAEALQRGGSILQQTTLAPLGVARGKVGGLDAHVLIHPEQLILPQRALSLFADVHEGEELLLMRTTQEALLKRANAVAEEALRRHRLTPADLCGGIMIYCAGCLLSISDRAGEMLGNFTSAIGGASTVSAFTFGEEGCVIPRRFDHGNLMAGVLLLSTLPA